MSTQNFTPSDTFSQGVMVALETDLRGEATSGNNAFWFQGGTWVPIITQELPSLYDQQELIFPAGHAGKRSLNQQPPVQGRRWSSGGFSVVATSEFLGHLLYASMGTASTNTVPSTDVVLLSLSPIEAPNTTHALETQPSDSGAKLQITVSGTNGSAALTVAGVDSEGNNASETISYDAGNTTLWTRTSFSSVTGITHGAQATDAGGASIQVNGIKYFEHDFTVASINPTFSIEKVGDPSAGAASISFMYVGMVLTDMTMNNPAEQRDGVINIEGNWEGDPSTTCTAKTLQEASSLRIWPAWILSLTRDNVSYTRPTNVAFTVNTGARNYRSAAGVQNPQGSFFGARELTGSLDLLLSNESEFIRWRGASKQALRLTWTAPWKLTGTDNEKLEASMINAYLESVDTSDNDGMFMYSGDFRTVVDSVSDIASFRLTNGIPAEVYGGSTVIG
jgi:hypothetical protein